MNDDGDPFSEEALEMRLAEVLELSGALQALAHTTAEHREILARLTKRPFD